MPITIDTMFSIELHNSPNFTMKDTKESNNRRLKLSDQQYEHIYTCHTILKSAIQYLYNIQKFTELE